jgi:hypothetical protein
MSGTLSNAIPAAPAQSGGNVGGLAAGAGAAGLGALLAGLAGNGGGAKIDVGKIINAIKKMFEKNGHVQGDKPYEGGALTGPRAYDPTKFMGFPGPDPEPQGRVTTDYNFSYPNNIFDDIDANYLNPNFTGPNDPSRGTGVGPGMWNYRGGGTSNDWYEE